MSVTFASLDFVLVFYVFSVCLMSSCLKSKVCVDVSNFFLYNIADAEYSSKVANLAIDRQRNRILTTKATREALKLADEGKLAFEPLVHLIFIKFNCYSLLVFFCVSLICRVVDFI